MAVMRAASLGALLLLSSVAINAADAPAAPVEPAMQHHDHGAAPAAAAMPGDSLYQLPVHFETAAGEHLLLSQYRGQPIVVTMFYGTCKSVCPLLAQSINATAAALPAGMRDKVHFVMVTLDPARDSMAELSRFATQHKLASPQIEVVRTDDEGVRLLAAALGIRYRQLPDGNFNHTSLLTALDADGVPKARTEKLALADVVFVEQVAQLVR